MSGVIVAVEGATKRFATRFGPVDALAPVDLAIAGGEIVVLIGPSGCGKTTLLRSIAGLETPSDGVIRVGTLTPAEARRSKTVGLVPQAPALLPWRTVDQNVRLLTEVNRSAGADQALRSEQIDDLVAAVGLTRFARAKPSELSGGMAQRVSLVRAFALGAPLLLMDEPFAALDEITRAEMRRLLLDLWSRYRPTIVFTTHSLEEAVLLADRVAVMAASPGRVVRVATVGLPRPHAPGVEDSADYLSHLRSLRGSLREAMALGGRADPEGSPR